MALDRFHPAVRTWFLETFADPTQAQRDGWQAISRGEHVLIAAPTGSGKTLAAFLSAIDELVREQLDAGLGDETRVVYVSPLKALSSDVERNLQRPLLGIREALNKLGFPAAPVTSAVRTGDTSSRDRASMLRKPPHLFVTTPESLYLLLTSEGGRRMLQTARTVIVDEIHALVGNRRGAHLALSLERLEALCGRRLQRIGLSATQKPIETVAGFLVGPATEQCTIIDATRARELDLAIEIPNAPLEAVMSNEVWDELYDRIAAMSQSHRTTLVFVNTRRLAERAARKLADRIGDDVVAAHHGSLARDRRLAAEQRLKAGSLRVMVATASLELGIDIGSVDLVCQIGSPRSLAGFIQRVGRSRHEVGGVPKGRLFPTSRDDLVECTALLRSVRAGELDRVCIPDHPLDVLAQQIVATCVSDAWAEDALFDLVRRARPYANLPRELFDSVLKTLVEGFHMRGARRSAYLHHDAVNNIVRARKNARLIALTSGGAIPDTADYAVTLDADGTIVGSVHEDFAIESLAGDVFQLGNTSWRIIRVETGRVRVEDAKGQPPTMPFWVGEAPGRSDELSMAVSQTRAALSPLLHDIEGARAWVGRELALEREVAAQLVDYLAATRAALGVLPTQTDVVLERFFDESGGMQLVLHSAFGSRINRAWGLALRKKFCQRFNFELQAAATDDAIVLSLGPTHSFVLADVFSYLHSRSAREVLIQAMLVAPMFAARWRWNATRSLAIPRFRNGRKVAPQLQRMQAEDLMSLVFPDQVACAENLSGPREVPDHPLVRQTVEDCLSEAMDIDGLERVLQGIEVGSIRTHACDLTEPSPLAQEILNARPYAFLDDAPLEERRTQAVMARRWLDPQAAADLGALDIDAIAEVRREAWPKSTDPETLHDALMQLAFARDVELRTGLDDLPFDPLWLARLNRDGRVVRMQLGDVAVWSPTERAAEIRAAHAAYVSVRHDPLPVRFDRYAAEADDAALELVRDTMACSGPCTLAMLRERFTGLPEHVLEAQLTRLEAEGTLLRGRFIPGEEAEQWCERGLLARIHRYTIGKLRREISPVTPAEFQRFLQRWQYVEPDRQAEGPAGLMRVLEQLEGFEAPASTWEADILPARVKDYDRTWLDSLCLSGHVTWLRLTLPDSGSATPIRSTPIALVRREHAGVFAQATAELDGTVSNATASDGPSASNLGAHAAAIAHCLRQSGASFHRDLVKRSGLLPAHVDAGLAELVARGLATSDAFAGLRALLTPEQERNARRGTFTGMETAGRWSCIDRTLPPPEEFLPHDAPDRIEVIARILLARYGVVVPRVLVRERQAPPWRELVRVYRRLEARGEIRGGRFVENCPGEHFALPEAVQMLREVRRAGANDAFVALSSADPLCLVGVLDGNGRMPPRRKDRVLYRDGIVIALREAGAVRWLTEIEPGPKWQAETMLTRHARFRFARTTTARE